jgi:DNA-binding SARP family transcriptional activator
MSGTELLEREATPNRAPPSVELRLLRAFELRRDGAPIALPISAQRLVAFLALHDRPLQRGYVAGTLWLDTTDERAGANLRSTLWRMGRAAPAVLTSTATHLALRSTTRVDVHELRLFARELVDPAARIDAVALRGEIVGALTHDLLPDWLADDFVLIEQERWRQLRVHALEALAARLGAVHRHGEAIDAALAAVAAEPLRESARRTLVSAHLAEGNMAEALRSYETFRALLDRELGLAPSAAMETLVAPLRSAG